MKKRLIPHISLNIHKLHLGLSGVWIVAVTVAFVGALVVALCSVIIFIGTLDVESVSVDTVPSVTSINRADLTTSVRIIDRRVGDFEQTKTAPPAFPDPSI